jgi:AsmA-like C-terminal region
MDRIHREADERARKLAEEKARREAEEQAKRDAEERTKREAEEHRRREAEEKARREAEEKAKREAEERRRREAEERARREAEEKAKREAEERRRREEEDRRRREDEERRRREEEERERREAEDRRRREEEKRRAEEDEERRKKEEDKRRWEIEARAQAAELEEQVRLERAAKEEKARAGKGPRSEASELEAAMRAERAEAEERVRRENEERVRREEEERRRQQEEAKLRPAEVDDVEEEMRRREEEMRRREQEEAERAKQEAKARTEADAKATAEARARERAVQEEQTRVQAAERKQRQRAQGGRGYRRPRNIGKPLAAGLFLILVISVAVLHFVPIDSAPYEKSAQEWLGQPVRIGAVYVALMPSPHLRFEKVTIGKEPQMRIAEARGSFDLLSLFEDRKRLRRVDMAGGTVPQAFLAALLTKGGAGGAAGIERVTGKGMKLDIPGFSLPDLDVDATLDSRGAITGVRLSSPERRLTATLQPEADRATLELTADKFSLPIGGNLALDEFSAKGVVGRTELALSEFEGRALNGTIKGNGRLRWGDSWTLDGEFSVRQMDAALIASPIVAGGKLEGKGVYGMKAAAPDKLFEAARMEGRFTIQKGAITNVDMTRVLQGSSTGGGTTLFSEMSGAATADAGRIRVSQLRMAAGLLQGVGNVDVDAEKNLSGRVQIELRAQSVQARATLSVSGSLQNPLFRRTN